MSNEDQEPEDDRQHAGALTTAPDRAGQIQRRDFAGTSMAITSAATEALVAAARADTEARWIMAMRNPRNLEDVRVNIMAECRRPGFAEVATYARPVGREQLDEDGPRGKKGEWVEAFAEGLSIRFAEVAMRCAGNMQCKARVTYDDHHVRMLTVTAVDYETNATWDTDITIKKTVERRKLRRGQKSLGERENSYGDRVYIVEATDDEVRVKAAAEVSKASRTAILRLIPGHIQDEAFELCKKVAADKQAKDPQAAKRRMIDAFAEQGIKPSAIEQWLGHSIDTGTRDEFTALSKIISGIRERELVWNDVLTERMADLAERAKGKPTSTAQPQPTTAAPAATAQPQPATAAAPATDPPAPTAPAPAPREAAAPSKSSGKGTGALKSALKGKAEDPPAGQLFVAPTPQARRVTTDLPPGTPPAEQGNEYRTCAGCDAIVEAPISAPPGTLCGDCSAAARE